ncbi:hypothetical protein [uncultured Aquabacterium sp.]|uniref:hypothetical protein n=1 Tax=uncultured Aquabacterium sp. TaxID=158753 RepID=UPI0025F8528E|nr:hypothetical protein [uncultured Aquabacterium sp.]
MIDSKHPFVLEAHRVHYACAVERPDEELSLGEKVMFVLIVLAGLVALCGIAGFIWATYGDLFSIAWEHVAQLMGSKQ